MTGEKKKGALESWGILGSLFSLGSFTSLFTYFIELYTSIPPELIQDTKVFITVTLFGVISSLISLIGRWRAVTRIEGILPKKK